MDPKLPNAVCEHCTLKNEPCVPSYAPNPSQIAVVGEAPGAEEVRKGTPFVGMSGILLENAFVREGVDYESVWRTNVVACRPPGNRTPTNLEVKCCRPRLEGELNEFPGKTIITVGKEAADAVLPHTAGYKVSERQGHWFEAYGKPVLATWHPAYVLRRPSEAKNFFDDIHRATHGTPEHFLQQPPTWTSIDTLTSLAWLAKEIPVNAKVAWDLETDQVIWYEKADEPADEILMMGITWHPHASYIIHPKLIYDRQGQKILREIFDRDDVEFIAHNGKFDVIFMRSVGILNARCDWDTMLAHYALWEETGYHGLKQLALNYYGLEDYERELVQKYLKSRNDRYSKVPYEDLALYCAWDVCVTLQLRHDLEKDMVKQDVYEWPFKNLFMPMQGALTDVEWEGVPVDREHVESWAEKMYDYCDRLEDEMCRIADNPELNPRSPQQVAHVLYVVRKLPRPKARGVAPTSTSKKALMHIKVGQDVFVDTLRQYRRVHKLNKSYNVNLLSYMDVRGRVHPSALIHGTEVGRLSYRNPAIQTIPRPYEDMYGAIVRSAFCAPPGWMFILADYSQAELRVAAILSEEPFLLNVYREGRDLHSEVAVAMYGPDFTKAQRVLCKMFNFSYLYGGSEYSFAEDAGLPVGVARQFVRDYNALMPVLAEWKAEQFQKIRTRGYVVSPFGRKRRCLLLTTSNMDEVRKAAAHAPVAGTASDLTQLSLIEAVERGHHVVLTVHDSIGELAPMEHAKEMAEELKAIMINTATANFPQVPWEVDVAIRERWAPLPEEIHGYEVRTVFG